jgi:hypothetical protein
MLHIFVLNPVHLFLASLPLIVYKSIISRLDLFPWEERWRVLSTAGRTETQHNFGGGPPLTYSLK